VDRIEADPEPEEQSAVKAGPAGGGARLDQFIASKEAGALRDLIRRAALDHQLEEELLVAVVFAESAFDPRAVSPKGAMGLMQLMPDTAARLGVEQPFDPWENLNGGAAYLRQLTDKYGGDLKLALAAYNAGEGRVLTYQGVPPFSETVSYISRVITLYQSFREGG
jgi:soluble lytic murein transglycosylase-like protein